MKISDEIKSSIVETHKSTTLSYVQIAEKFNVHKDTVKRALVKAGLKLKNYSEGNRKYEIDDKYFDEINTEEKAYFLGFLYADGYNNTKAGYVKLALKYTDKDILERLNNLLQPSHPLFLEKGRIKDEKKGYYNSKPKYILTICNKKISQKLSNLGLTQAKTFTTEFPKWLNKDLQRHFIRGYFDGDGCITTNNKRTNTLGISILGTENFLSSIQDIFLSDLGFEKTKLYEDKRKTIDKNYNIVTLMSIGNLKVAKIKEYFYNDSTIFLQRKYDKFNQLNN